MIFVTIRTDKPDAEIGLFENNEQKAYEVWHADRQLAETIHQKLQAVLSSTSKTYDDIGGIVCYSGPGSFTGLRIGISVGNALAYSLSVPIVGTNGDQWSTHGIDRLQKGENDQEVVPDYGSLPHITQQKK